MAISYDDADDVGFGDIAPAKPLRGEKREKFLKAMRSRFERAESAWNDDRQRYVDDLRFLAGDQWPETAKRGRELKGRPTLVVDKLSQYCRQVINDSRQNRPGIKVRGVDRYADDEIAEVYQGLIRHIADRSNADIAYDTALECAVRGGHGFVRVLTEYVSPTSFDQDLCVKRVRNPLTVVYDPDCQEPDGSDAKFCFIYDEIEKDEYEEKFGDEFPVDFEAKDLHQDWYSDNVRIAEYWYVEDDEKTLYRMADGNVVTREDLELARSEGIEIPEILEERTIEVPCVYWCRVSGKDIIEEPRKWPGRYIPVVPVWGNEFDIEGEVSHTGLIHAAKDAQRLYNYSRSSFAERVSLAPKAPYIAAAGQIEQYEREWNNANSENHSVLRYDPQDVAGVQVPPPMRQPASDIPAGFAQDMQMSEHDIQASIGMYQASLGAPSNERTGRAITARQREGDVATFHYHDNLNRAIRQIGRILVDLIPKIYDTQRVVRILGEDGTATSAQINPDQEAPVQRMGMSRIYNLGVGASTTTVTSGPSYTTMRQEVTEAMTQMVQADPSLMRVFGDVWVENMDWPGAGEIAGRLRMALLPEIQQMLATQAQVPKEFAPVAAQLQQAVQQREQALQALQQQMQQLVMENQQLKASAEADAAKAAAMMQANTIKQYDAETKRLDVLMSGENEDSDREIKAQQIAGDQAIRLLQASQTTNQTPPKQ